MTYGQLNLLLASIITLKEEKGNKIEYKNQTKGRRKTKSVAKDISIQYLARSICAFEVAYTY